MNLYETIKSNLNETTSKELNRYEDVFRQKVRAALRAAGDSDPDNMVGWVKRLPEDMVKELKQEEAEYRCIGMLHSILTYGGSRDVDTLLQNRYLQQYIDELGYDRVKELAQGEIDEYNNAEIINDVYTDTEGVSYNSVKFHDDINDSEELKEEVGELSPRFDSRQSFYGKARVDHTGNTYTLISYSTPILKIENGNIEVLCGPDALSQTTMRHVRDFLKQMDYDGIIELSGKDYPITKKWLMDHKNTNINESAGYTDEVSQINSNLEAIKNNEEIDYEVNSSTLDFPEIIEEIPDTNDKIKALMMLYMVHPKLEELKTWDANKIKEYILDTEEVFSADNTNIPDCTRYRDAYKKCFELIGATLNESAEATNINNLSKDQLWKLRQEIVLGSIYVDDYENSFGIPAIDVCNFFDSFIDEMEHDDYGNPIERKIEEYDNPEELFNYYSSCENPFGEIENINESETIQTRKLDDCPEDVKTAVYDFLYNNYGPSKVDEIEKTLGDIKYEESGDNNQYLGFIYVTVNDKEYKLDIDGNVIKEAEELNESVKEIMKNGMKESNIKSINGISFNESKNLKESSTVIWSSETTEDDYDPEELKERYQEYKDEKDEAGEDAKDFDDWKYDYIADDSYDQWDLKEDDLKENIYPMIDNQINNDILIIAGNYNSNYPDFRPSGKGGKLLNSAEDILNWLSNEDNIEFINTNGIIGVNAYDHDGSIGGNLYTLPDDKNLLYEIAMKTGYYDDDRDIDDVLGEFSYDLNHDSIDMSDLAGYEDKFIPIKVTW